MTYRWWMEDIYCWRKNFGTACCNHCRVTIAVASLLVRYSVVYNFITKFFFFQL